MNRPSALTQRIRHSIITRLMVIGIAIILSGLALRFYITSTFLRAELENIVAAQLDAFAGYVASDIEQKIGERQHFLRKLAASLPPALLGDPQKLQQWLAERQELQPLFTYGIVALRADGMAVADAPAIPGRSGNNYRDRDFIKAALAGNESIGRPVVGRSTGKPLLPMAAPIRDAHGRIIGAIAGATALAEADFLDLLQSRKIGASGGFLLISPADGIFVAASKPELIFKPVAAPGINRLHDQAMKGWRGTGITVNAQGVEEIVAVASVPSTGWFLVARLPTEEAFAMVGRAKSFLYRNVLPGAILLILLAGLTLFFVLRPLFLAADQAERMTRGELPLAPLPVVKQDEVGHLTTALNRLISKLLDSQRELSQIAHHDILTGLPNRLLLTDRVEQALARAQRNDTRLALLFLDLDNFKAINDNLGHEAGDSALAETARRFSGVVRDADTLARVGGDEFVLLVPDLEVDAVPGAVLAIATKLIDTARQPMIVCNETRQLGVSVGIAIGDKNSSFDGLMSTADQAMYEAKKTGAGYRLA